MSGKMIVFEGTDGSGKSTQFKLLCDRVNREGKSFRQLVFPRYDQPSSALIRMYLGGEFGKNPGDVNPYAASAFTPSTATHPSSRTGGTTIRRAD